MSGQPSDIIQMTRKDFDALANDARISGARLAFMAVQDRARAVNVSGLVKIGLDADPDALARKLIAESFR